MDTTLPRKVSCVCTLFLKKGGRIQCRVIGRQRYSIGLSQGGVRVELRYSGIIFVDLIFCGTLISVGLIFVVERISENQTSTKISTYAVIAYHRQVEQQHFITSVLTTQNTRG